MGFRGVSFLSAVSFLVCEVAGANQPLASFGAKLIGNLSGSKTKVQDTNHGGGNNDKTSLQNGGNCWAFGAAAVFMAKEAADYKRKEGERMSPNQFADRWVKRKDEMTAAVGRANRQDGGTLAEGKRWLDQKGVRTGALRSGAPTAADFKGSVALDIAYYGPGSGHIVAAYSYDMAVKMGLVGAKKKAPPKRRQSTRDDDFRLDADSITEQTEHYLEAKTLSARTSKARGRSVNGNASPSRELAGSKNVAYIIDSSKQAGVYEIALDTGLVYGMMPNKKGTQTFGEATLKSFFGSVRPGGFFAAKF